MAWVNSGLVAVFICAVCSTSATMAAGPRVTLVGNLMAPEEAGEQFYLRLAEEQVFSGDPVCKRKGQNSIDLWDVKENLQSRVGKTVSVSGELDCPRGGYVLRSVKFERVNKTAKAQADQASKELTPKERAQRTGLMALRLIEKYRPNNNRSCQVHVQGAERGMESAFPLLEMGYYDNYTKNVELEIRILQKFCE